MYLRKLKIKDSNRMHEWMQNEDITRFLKTNFKSYTVDDCIQFITKSNFSSDNINLAVANSDDLYLGTVSLKNIDYNEGNAEFAIVMHSDAIGTGEAIQAMKEILRYGHMELKLRNIFWCVREDNIRAFKFYKKNNFKIAETVPEKILDQYRDEDDLVWFIG